MHARHAVESKKGEQKPQWISYQRTDRADRGIVSVEREEAEKEEHFTGHANFLAMPCMASSFFFGAEHAQNALVFSESRHSQSPPLVKQAVLVATPVEAVTVFLPSTQTGPWLNILLATVAVSSTQPAQSMLEVIVVGATVIVHPKEAVEVIVLVQEAEDVGPDAWEVAEGVLDVAAEETSVVLVRVVGESHGTWRMLVDAAV